MHTNGPKEDPLVELGYDHRDVDYKRLRKAIIGFLSFGVVSALIGAFIYTNRFWVFQIPEPKPGIDAELKRTVAPAGTPFIQDNVASKTDIMTLRQWETKRMTGTGYTDDSHQFAYIPVDKAMEIVAQRGVGGTGSGSTGVTDLRLSGQSQPADTHAATGTTEPSAPATSGAHQ